MKCISKNYIFTTIVLSFILMQSCKKEELPVLSTSSITNITSTSAIGGGNITSDGNSDVISRGVCWSLEPNPTTKDSKTEEGSGDGQFVSNISGLDAGTTYHVRAYATNSVGTAYGADMSFSTLGEAPECITQPATNISPTAVTLNGTINANHVTTSVTFEYGPTSEYGQTISAVQSPVSGNSITNVSVSITGLAEGTTYHFRVKAINSIGSDEGEDMTFTTSGQAPEATTQLPTNVTTVTATLNGSVNANQSSTVVTFEYGPTNAYGSTVTVTPSPVTGNSSTVVSAGITGLTPGMVYHYRIKAVSSLGTDYGEDMTITTVGQVPIAITQQASNVQVSTATMNGTVNANHLPTVFSFEYGLTSSYGNTASPASNQVTGTADVRVSINPVGLTGGTIYHYRVVATNLLGTTYGDDVTFITDEPFSLSTNSVTGVTYNSAVVGGSIANNGGFAISSRGACWSKNPNPTINNEHTITGAGEGSFTSPIKCLDEQSTYYVRAFATYSGGTVYGNQESFSTDPCPIVFNPNLTYRTVMDLDGNCYKTIQIGDQVWMAENLRTSRYNDGYLIPNVTSAVEWSELCYTIQNEDGEVPAGIGAYCWYDNDSITYENEYGKLYNWMAVSTGKLCPVGWRIPVLSELTQLKQDLDPFTNTWGSYVMETGNDHWAVNPFPEGIFVTNSTGFTALPGGSRATNGEFSRLGQISAYWASDKWWFPNWAYRLTIPFHSVSSPSMTSSQIGDGLSVRCIKDN